MVENGYQIKNEVEGKMDCLGFKAASKFNHRCKYCGKGFLNQSYVKKHEENVCKKKSQTAQNEIYIINEAFEKPAETEFEDEFVKVKEEFLGFWFS